MENKPQWGKFIYTVFLAFVIGLGYYNRDAALEWFKNPTLKMPGAETKSSAPQVASPASAPEKKERKIKFWWDPMMPDYKSDRPGKSPMGMDMVPVYEDEDQNTDGAVIKIDPAVTQNIGVRYAPARLMDMKKIIRTVGVVTYDETKLSRIQSKVAGWVEKLYVNATGNPVHRDTIMLELYSPDLVSSQEEFLLAMKYRESMKSGDYQTIAEGGEKLYESALLRLKLMDVPAHQIRELMESRQVKKTLHIHSPVEGVVIKKDVVEGMYIQPNLTLYEIADLRKVWVNMDVFEYELPSVKIGQQAVMTLASFPGKKFEGKITYIYPFVDPKTRSIKVRLEFPNPNMALKPDMYGNVEIEAGGIKDAVVVPSEAIIQTGARSMAFVDRGEGKFDPREVQTGLVSGGYTQILSGVNAGERVVTSSQFLIDSEAKLREAVNKMSATPANQPVAASQPQMQMDHSQMSHGDQPQMQMDHSQMNHGDQPKMQMDHSQMSHGDQPKMQMDHSQMQHNTIPPIKPGDVSTKPLTQTHIH